MMRLITTLLLAMLATGPALAQEEQLNSGGMNPCNENILGTIAEGGYADLILVEGNPLQTLDALQRDKVHFVMKNGTAYKNQLP